MNNPIDFISFAESLYTHSLSGKLKYSLYEFQKYEISRYIENQNIIDMWSVMSGYHMLMATYILWLTTQPDYTAYVTFPTKKEAVEFMDKIKMLVHMNELLYTRSSDISISFSNRSIIVCDKARSDSCHGMHVNLFVLMNVTKYNHDTLTHCMDSIMPCVMSSQSGKIIINGFPDHIGSAFHRLWIDSINGLLPYTPISVPWTCTSLYWLGDEWRKGIKASEGINAFNSRFELQFSEVN